MKSNQTTTSGIGAIFPRTMAGIIGLSSVALLAFLLGGIFFGGDASEDSHGHEASSDEVSSWTCSMHPSIQLPSPGQCPICGMDLIPVSTDGGEELAPRQIRMSESARMLARIATTEVRRQPAERQTRMVGKLTYDETKLAYITAWVPGRLDRLYADYTGIRVNKGDHMVHLYSPELLATQEELIQAIAAARSLRNSSGTLFESARSTVEAARDKLRLYGLAADQIDRIESSGSASDHLTINAPVGGVVVHKNAKEGMYVQTGSRIYTIADLSRLWVLFEAYESDLAWLRYGQKVVFSSTAYPGQPFEGTITFIDPVLDPKTRTAGVRAIVDNPGGRLKPAMLVTGVVHSRLNSKGEVVDENLAGKWIGPMHPEIIQDEPGDCEICGMPLVPAESLAFAVGTAQGGLDPLVIPASAPLITGRRSVVYVERTDSEGELYEGREVTLGSRVGDAYIVMAGLEEGELVVVNGAFKIDAELQIRAKPSMMSPKGGGSMVGHNHGGMTGTQVKSGMVMEPLATEVSPKARDALSPVYAVYFEIQSALAADSFRVASSAFAAMAEAVDKVDMGLFTGERHMKWMGLAESLTKQSSSGFRAEDIAGARAAFEKISETVIELERAFGHAGEARHFLTFCPMAFDGKGAYWLQTGDAVNNSYFGASMLTCGSVKETFSGETGHTH